MNDTVEIMKGKFIEFEGIDGTGKGTQMHLAARYLFELDKANNVLCTKEPTSGMFGVQIRQILKSESDPLSGAEKCFDLYIKDRILHCEDVVIPTLAQEKRLGGNYKTYILCDRFWYSTYAYQGAQGIDKNRVIEANNKFPVPDLVLIYDLSTEESEKRRQGRDSDKSEKFEQTEFQRKVRENYLELKSVLQNTNIQVIDAKGTIEEVFERTKLALNSILIK